MPKMFLSAPAGTFDETARKALAADLTELGINCERLADKPSVRDAVWVFFHDYPAGYAFNGGAAAMSAIVTLVTYSLRGGLDGEAKTRFVREATALIGRLGEIGEPVPAFVLINEINPQDWGMFGHEGDLAKLRASSD